MTSYLNQTIARQQIAELISQAEQGRVRRELRRSRREARAARRANSARRGPSNSTLCAPGRIGLAGVR
jgi:rRNA processing protein Krr1/Pno1